MMCLSSPPSTEVWARPVIRTWRERSDTPPQEAYRDYLLALDTWRRLPYADPGLPARLLPANWPGVRSADVFHALHARLRDAGEGFVLAGPGATHGTE